MSGTPEVVNNMPEDTKAVNQPRGRRAPAKPPKPAKPAEKKRTAPKPATTQALAKRAPELMDREMSLFERFAKDPKIGVEKLDKLIDAQVRIRAINAEAAFNEAFAQMQAKLPTVVKHGKIFAKDEDDGNKRVVRSRYAKYEDIIGKIRPIMSEFGFSIRHETKMLDGGWIEIKGVLMHRAGHSVTDTFTTKPDSGGRMNDIQRIGSAKSYGKRYTLLALVGIATEDEDDDGTSTGARKSGKQYREEQAKPAQPAAGSDGKGDEVITDNQRKRLWTIIKNVGRPDTEVKMWLTVKYKIESTKKIPKRLYEEICKAVEAPGALPLPADDREPGSDG